jgi:uncharacterized membrane protein YidH (DUF202 family)
MNRTTITFVVGTVVALGWQSLGPNARGGTTDPGAERLYQSTGLTLFVFGLVLLAMAFYRWLSAGHYRGVLARKMPPVKFWS